jgi:hypothetical protein
MNNKRKMKKKKNALVVFFIYIIMSSTERTSFDSCFYFPYIIPDFIKYKMPPITRQPLFLYHQERKIAVKLLFTIYCKMYPAINDDTCEKNVSYNQ